MAVSAGIIVAWSILLLYLVTVAYYAVLYQRNFIVVQGGRIARQAAALLSAWLFLKVPFAGLRKSLRCGWSQKRLSAWHRWAG